MQQSGTQIGDWGLAFTPYAWFAAQSTDVGGQALRQSFNDLASITNVGFQGRMLARWRWLTFAADWTYSEMASGQEIGRITANHEINQHILDMKMGGKVFDNRTSGQDGGVGIWVAAGARYWDNQTELVVSREPILPIGEVVVDTLDAAQSWWDPVLGVTLQFPVTPSVSFLVRATGGGLGIGDASSFLWDAEFGALFRISRRWMISAGYRQFKYERTDGEGEDEVKQTVSVVGPEIGLSFGIF
ncbi:MAG: hypothetical protein ACWGSQ_12480 [Longimicrobiales bacterium]